METIKTDLIIIGAGLTGLTLAYYLKQHNLDFVLIEARDRLGGRIYTKQNPNNPPIEMGATWISPQHTLLLKLLQELGVKTFEQKMGDTAIYEAFSTSPFHLVSLPKSEIPSYRVQQGTQQIIEKLAAKIDNKQIYTSQNIQGIQKVGKTITATSKTHHFKGAIVISTLPPLLFADNIKVSPLLPNDLSEIAKKTHTWMGDSIKIALSYRKKFWKQKHLSGTIFSNVGPISEMYDHSNVEDSHFALKGFLNGAYFGISKEERLKLVLNQLEKYYGSQVNDFINYEEVVWKNEPYTSTEASGYILPHQNNGNAVYQKGYLDNTLFLAGTETSPLNGGYMEGAVHSANHIYITLKSIGLLG
ncbi:FAD-dependent oxidoreductase [Flavobacteriaceae bacterium KMM 6898]|nr:FAD-dependent oxidoreductase [Flavobacteriaceae bacterium KMM 6898]